MDIAARLGDARGIPLPTAASKGLPSSPAATAPRLAPVSVRARLIRGLAPAALPASITACTTPICTTNTAAAATAASSGLRWGLPSDRLQRHRHLRRDRRWQPTAVRGSASASPEAAAGSRRRRAASESGSGSKISLAGAEAAASEEPVAAAVAAAPAAKRKGRKRAAATTDGAGSAGQDAEPRHDSLEGEPGGSSATADAITRATAAGEAGSTAASAEGAAASDGNGRRRRRPRKLSPGSPAVASTDDPTKLSVPSSYDSDCEEIAAASTPRSRGRTRRVAVAASTSATSATVTSLAAQHRGAYGSGSGDVDGGDDSLGPPAVVFSSKLPRGSPWSDVRQWVVFSDLHVRESSLPTCLEVLRAVEAEAVARGGGVLFLGDFWDRRGSLPVEPLNQVLQEMSRWRCPVLMLVGNHDQVDLGGLQHGLTPLELACPHVHVFDEPTIWRGALWLPYRRDTVILERAMAQAVATGGVGGVCGGQGDGEGPPLAAIFLHADVRTARNNQWRQAEEGLEPGVFPAGIPVYSGHYHLPHTVRGTNITYVGSPYQVSMNEASESKRLLVLEAPSWRVVEEIPLTIGPRHLRLSGPAACDHLRQLAEEAAVAGAAGGGGGADGDAGTGLPSGGDDGAGGGQATAAGALRHGDRVKLWLSAEEAQDERVVQAMAELEAAGVSVEQVMQPHARAARVAAAEGLSAEELVEMYCSGGGGGGAGAGARLSQAAAAAVRAAVAEARDAAGAGADGDGPTGRCVELELESVRLRGFGPFVEEQTYPLAGRGVRVLLGQNLDEPGADSNGAGKTSLVTAPLWALTGDVLARTESGGGGRLPVDVMRNDGCGSAFVALSGRLNGKDFRVEREVKRGKTSGLTLRLGDEDLTLQDISGTADRIRRLFATDLLRSCSFFGQNDITGLLEANDATLKQKLGLVVDLEIWEAARQLLVAPRRAAAAAAAAAEGRARVLEEQRARRAAEVEELRRQEAEWAAEQMRRLEQQEVLLGERAGAAAAAAAELQPCAAAARHLVSELYVAIASAEEEQRRVESELRAARQATELAASQQQHQPHPDQDRQGGPGGAAAPQRATTTTSPCAEEQREEQQRQREEEERGAAQLLRERQGVADSLQRLLAERQGAAAVALGRLRQLESSLREYQGAVAAAAAASRQAVATAVAGAAVTGPAAVVSSGEADPTGGGEGQVALLQRRGAALTAGDGGNGRWRGGRGDERRSGGEGGTLREWAEHHDGGGGGDGGRAVVAAPPGFGHTPLAGAILAVCDRCRQPISQEQYGANVERLQGGIAEAREAYEAAAAEERAALAAHTSAATLVAEANAAVLELQRRRIESERRLAAEARAAAAAAELEARAAGEAARRAREAAWREAEGALRGLQLMMAASARIRGDLVAAATDLERAVSELDNAADTWSGRSVAVRRDAAGAAGAALTSALPYSYAGGVAAPADDSVVSNGPLGDAAAGAAVTPRGVEQLLAAAKVAAAAARGAAAGVLWGLAAWREAEAALGAARRELNPRSELRARAHRELEELDEQVAQAEAAVAAADGHVSALNDADRALGRSGIPSLVLDDVLAQLQAYTASYLTELCADFVLELSATKPAAGSGGAGRGGAGGKEKEEINKVIRVRNPADGSLRHRDVRQLSGGERRRVALALCLGFQELVRRRRRLLCNVIVLDEVLQQLDGTGCELVARVLRDLPHQSVLVVGQTSSTVTANFDLTDVVLKQGGASRVRLDA